MTASNDDFSQGRGIFSDEERQVVMQAIFAGEDEAERREAAASPSTGSIKVHQLEEKEIVAHALNLSARQAAAELAKVPPVAELVAKATPVSD